MRAFPSNACGLGATAGELHDEIRQVLHAVSANLEAVQLVPEGSRVAGQLAESVSHDSSLQT